jgi:hypothetical protein
MRTPMSFDLPALLLAVLLGSSWLACGGSSSGAGPGVGASGGSTGTGGSDAGGSGGVDTGPEPTGDPLWARRGDGLGRASKVALFADGGLAVVGLFQDTIDFGAGALASAGQSDGFVARFDADGACLWSTRFGGSGDDKAEGVAIDGAGNVVVTGNFSGDITIGDDELLSAVGGNDVPLLKLSGEGALLWAKSFGGPGSDIAWDVASGADGAIALMGESAGPIDFGGGALAGTESTFVAVLDGSGAHSWSRMLDHAQFNDLARDGSGHVVLGGSFSGTIDLGSGPITSVAGQSGLVARFDPSGETVFATSVGGDPMSGYAVGAGPDGTIVFGGLAYEPQGPGTSVVVHKLAPDGEALWSLRIGSADYAAANAVAVDGHGHVVLAGLVRDGTVDFGCGAHDIPLDPVASWAGDMLLAKLDADGVCLWSKTFGGDGNQSAWGVAASSDGHVALAGELQTAIDFGLGPLVAEHYPEPCVASFGP